jgi:hypothetical protein
MFCHVYRKANKPNIQPRVLTLGPRAPHLVDHERDRAMSGYVGDISSPGDDGLDVPPGLCSLSTKHSRRVRENRVQDPKVPSWQARALRSVDGLR